MPMFGSQWFGSGAAGSGSYTVSNSFAFFRANDEAMQRQLSSTSTSTTKMTLSAWIKRSVIGTASQGIFAANNGVAAGSGGHDAFIFNSIDQINMWLGAGNNADITWSPKFQDTSAFYHFVLAIDTTQSTDTNRVKLYVNGVQVTDTSSANWPAEDQVFRGFAYTGSGTAPTQVLGTDVDHSSTSSRNEAGFVLAGDCIFIDGTAYDPTSFGEINSDTGIWTPIDPNSVTYGNNGFRLQFKETGTGQNASGMGADTSGNDGHFALLHSSTITAAKNRQVDVTTNDADSSLGNYGRINPEAVNVAGNNDVTISLGNLKGVYVADYVAQFSIARLTSGQWYWETKVSGVNLASTGVLAGTYYGSLDTSANMNSTGIYYYNPYSGNKMKDGSGTSYGSGASADDILQCAVDLDNNKIWWGLNNTWQASGDPAAGTNAAYTDLTDTDYTPVLGYGSAGTIELNCGQQTLSYTPPTGFKTLNVANITTPTVPKSTDQCEPLQYTGTGSELEISSLSFQPGFVLIKNLDATDDWMLFDNVNGATKHWSPNRSDLGGIVTTAQSLKSFDSDGFTLGTFAQVNTSAEKYLAFNWKTGSSGTVTNGMTKISDSSQTNITRAANPDNGLSIIQFTGNGSASTILHGLGKKVEFMFVKATNKNSVSICWHKVMPARGYIGFATESQEYVWGDDRQWGPDPTAGGTTSIGVGTHTFTNGSGDTLSAYVFVEIPGFNRISSYVGNGTTDGPFVWTGMRPSMIWIKSIDTTANWAVYNDVQTTNAYGNPTDRSLRLSSNETDANLGSSPFNIYSNGFKSLTGASEHNASGQEYMFIAWARSPFESNNRAR